MDWVITEVVITKPIKTHSHTNQPVTCLTDSIQTKSFSQNFYFLFISWFTNFMPLAHSLKWTKINIKSLFKICTFGKKFIEHNSVLTNGISKQSQSEYKEAICSITGRNQFLWFNLYAKDTCLKYIFSLVLHKQKRIV